MQRVDGIATCPATDTGSTVSAQSTVSVVRHIVACKSEAELTAGTIIGGSGFQ